MAGSNSNKDRTCNYAKRIIALEKVVKDLKREIEILKKVIK